MTFIASVVAKNGAAVIADSLVTTFINVMEWSEFTKYVQSKKKADGTINLDHSELINLFHSKESHTKNYEEKLFKYDGYSIVTTAGSAAINNQKIEELIEELTGKNATDVNFHTKTLEVKIKEFCDFFSAKAIEHINTYGRFHGTRFIFTHYNKETHKTIIYKIQFNEAIKKNLTDKDFKIYVSNLQPEQFKVVCDGQNRISEKILFGDFETATNFIPKIVDQIIKDHGIKIEKPDEYYISVFQNLQKSGTFATLIGDMKMFQLSQLSLQQAVDFACLLMRLEMDIQQYTKNIPTVGGLTKLATIDKNGVRLITGDGITRPKYIR